MSGSTTRSWATAPWRSPTATRAWRGSWPTRSPSWPGPCATFRTPREAARRRPSASRGRTGSPASWARWCSATPPTPRAPALRGRAPGFCGALVEQGSDLVSYLAIRDAQAAREAWGHDIGEEVHLSVGGKLDRLYNRPLDYSGTVTLRKETRFGKTVIVRHEGIHLIIAELPDPGAEQRRRVLAEVRADPAADLSAGPHRLVEGVDRTLRPPARRRRDR